MIIWHFLLPLISYLFLLRLIIFAQIQIVLGSFEILYLRRQNEIISKVPWNILSLWNFHTSKIVLIKKRGWNFVIVRCKQKLRSQQAPFLNSISHFFIQIIISTRPFSIIHWQILFNFWADYDGITTLNSFKLWRYLAIRAWKLHFYGFLSNLRRHYFYFWASLFTLCLKFAILLCWIHPHISLISCLNLSTILQTQI